MEIPENNQGTNNGRSPVVSTPQLAAAALVLSILTGAVFLTDISLLKPTSASAAAAETAEEMLPDPFDGMNLKAKSALALDLRDGTVLYEQNADTQLPLASLAKIALAISVAKVLDPEEYVALANDAYSVGSADFLRAGERWLVKDMIGYTLIGSSNGGATALAAAADAPLRTLYPDAQAREATLYAMNALVDELDLHDTYFLNPTGLDEDLVTSGAYGSARDIAKLLARSLEYTRLFGVTAEEKMVMWSSDGKKAAVAFNTNEALPVIPGLVFGKTGFTDLAGGNLAIVFEPEPAHPVAIVILGSTKEGRFSDVEELVRKVRDSL